MRRLWCIAMMLFVAPAGIAFAQDEPSPDQLKKMYRDALVQLKAAQDRKNQLASENEKLSVKVAELQKQVGELRKQADGFAEKTFFLRAYHESWREFLRQHPSIEARWTSFMASSFLPPPREASAVLDRNWPLLTEK